MSTTFALLASLVVFVGMLLLIELGQRIGTRALASAPESLRTGTGAIDGAILALLGLLIAFTFSGAAGRFDDRRRLIIVETNAIETAYLRLELLPASTRPALKESFRKYVASRLEAYRKLPDLEAATRELERSAELQQQIWRQSVAAAGMEEVPPSVTMLLLPALNQMIDITTTRALSAQMHPPLVIFVLLIVTALASSLLAGHAMAGTTAGRRLHKTTFAALTALSIYVIIDIEYPRLGLIRVDAFDQALVDLLARMSP